MFAIVVVAVVFTLFYFIKVPLGPSQLAADCKEIIKLKEGKEFNGKYWQTSIKQGFPVFEF